MGTTLREVIEEIGGGVPNGKKFKAAQTGGPSGGCIPASLIDTPLDYESMAAIGSIVGTGGLIVMDEDNCMVDIAKFFLEFTMDESCGKCTPCRIGTKRMYEILERITDGKGTMEDLDTLKSWPITSRKAPCAAWARRRPTPSSPPSATSVTNMWRTSSKRDVPPACAATCCPSPSIPKSARAARSAPGSAPPAPISGSVKTPHVIDTSKCVKCGACIEKCKFGAISKK